MGKAGEKQKRTPKTQDKRQYERFVEAARKLGVDEDPEAFERKFDKLTGGLVKPKRQRED